MGRDTKFSPGSFYRVDDRTGFPQRAERTRKEWTGLIVDEKVWEARQPQDLVRGVKDQQNVPDARPLAPNQFIGPIYAQMTEAADIGDVVLTLQSTAGMSVGDQVQVMLDNGIAFLTVITAIGAGTITLLDPLPYPAASGNLVADLRIPGVIPVVDDRITTTGDLRVTTTAATRVVEGV